MKKYSISLMCKKMKIKRDTFFSHQIGKDIKLEDTSSYQECEGKVAQVTVSGRTKLYKVSGEQSMYCTLNCA